MPTTTAAPTIQPVVIFATSFVSGIAWSTDYTNPNSNSFKTLATSISNNITSAYSQNKFGTAPLSTQINAFKQDNNGVDFYAELIYPDTTATTTSVTNALSSLGYMTNAFSSFKPILSYFIQNNLVSSTSQCSGLASPLQGVTTNPTLNPSNGPLVTTQPMIMGAVCDASNIALTNIFLVDVSVPIIGTLDDKLSKISAYLNNAASLVNLDQTNRWNNQEFRLVVYGANEPIPLGRARSQNSWNSVVANLNSTVVNPVNADGHQLTDALRFVYNNYRTLPGVAGNIIVVADGFDFDEAQSSTTIANALKSQYFYSLGVILMSTSQAQQGIVQQLASDYAYFYPIDSVDYLMNTAVLQTQAQWICSAYYPTAAPPTPPPTRLPLITTQGTTTIPNARTTVNPLLPPIAQCKQNVLFLIDQSQTLLLDGGYSNAIQFAKNTANALSSYNPQTTFAFVVFNGFVVSESVTNDSIMRVICYYYFKSQYDNLATFVSLLSNVPQSVGTSDVTVNDYKGVIPNVYNTTLNIRSQMQTQIIGVDLIETMQSKNNVQKTIQYGVYDDNAQSIYVGVAQPSDVLDPKVTNSTNYQLTCKDSSNCYVGLTFVIETSQAEGSNYVDVQTRAVLNVLSYYQSMISPFKMSVSMIYFSAPDNLIPNQSGQSASLFDQVTNAMSAINTLNITVFSLGAASDLQLGFSLTASSLRNGYSQDNNMVVFFARGAYEKLSNCCPDPSADAATVRSLATVQGVVIGPYSSKPQLDALTGSNSIDANSIIGTTALDTADNRASVAKQISDAILPKINSFINNQYCPGIPQFVNPPCEDPIDTLILLHADDKNNWNSILNFTANQLVPDLLGATGSSSSRALTTSTPMNFAIASYYYLDVLIHADFNYLYSPSDYQSLIKSITFRATKGTATLSTAYKKAIEIFQDGRAFASKNVILITDTMDISDMENAFSEHDAMVQLVGGYTSALTINTNTIPGADYQININQLNINNKYSNRQLANSLTQHTCTYLPMQPPTSPPVPPSPTLPGPIPTVKARNVWPDITILVDTSISADNAMSDLLFEKLRAFLDILLGKYSVGEKGSRFTIATYNGDSVQYSCIFAQINNYYDLSSCRNEQFSFFSKTHQTYRNIASALSNIRQNVYENSTSGYRSLNENFLIVFTLGSSSSPFSQELSNIQRKGIRTIAVGLSSSMSNTQLSAFAQSAYMVPTGTLHTPASIPIMILLIGFIRQQPKKELDQYVSSWKSSLSSSSYTANVGSAIQYVSNMIGTTEDRPTYIVYVIGGSNLTGTSYSKQLLSNCQLYAANYNISTASSYNDLVTSQNNIFSVSSSNSLVDRVAPFDVTSPNPILQLAAAINDNQQAKDSVSFPTSSIAADIILLLDETGLTDSDFSNMKKFLQDFTSQFTVGPTSTQFALQTYNGRTIPHDGFHLFESTSNNVVNQRIQQLTLAKATENSTDADLAGAIEQEVFFFLTEANGWRDDVTTYTIILSHADSFYTRDTSTAMQVKNMTTVFALGLNNMRFDYVRNFTNTGFYETVNNVSSLSINSPAVQDLIHFLDNGFKRKDYKSSVYPEPIPVKDAVKADFIFLVDNTLGSGFTPNVRSFLNSFVENVGNFSTSGNDTKLALVTYGKSVNTAWNLGDLQDIISLKNQISKFQIVTSDSGSSNLRRAIDSVILNEQSFGVASNRPNYIIVISGSQTISPNIDGATSRHLNTRYSTFVIQTNFDNTTYTYTPQVLGTQMGSDRVAHSPDLQYGNSRLNGLEPWISKEYMAWALTFPETI
ncbi:Protein CBG04137 [Caenorhabditis briggsae]|uniref:Protein CBG04137 n=1 Tax=Caenorhabditis briggsae TaxID=6238 RepID=A8WVN1_CAEBR|nr:Protein CBG04137 [Caenorhabditis briggsae]CAP24542.1 Protein CBG04137 [Caenorhabditis briggsae]